EGALVALARGRGLVTVVTIHGASFLPFARRNGWLAAAVLRRAHLVICLDEDTVECVRANAPGVATALVPNPIFIEDGVVPAEGMPMVLAEAMGLALPFISTPVGGIPELAREGGVLVPVNDEVALADAIAELLADPQRARSLGEAGRRFAERTRSVEVIDARL